MALTTAYSSSGGTSSITVTAVNDAPTITSGSTASVAENTTAVMTVTGSDPDIGDALTYANRHGGADAAKFNINSATGALTFATAPDYESPTDVGADNVYNVTVQVSDGTLTANKAVAVTVTNVNEAPTLTSAASASVAENTTAVMTVTASDPDAATTFTYALAGGADAAKFSINSATGALTFATAPDYESPTDVGADNVYNVTVQDSDGSLTATQAVAVRGVTDVPMTMPLSLPVMGVVQALPSVWPRTRQLSQPSLRPMRMRGAKAPPTALSGGADMALFTINASTGALSFISAPNYEKPTDCQCRQGL